MSPGLDEIVRATRRKVQEGRRNVDLRDLEKQAEQHVPRGFRQALQAKSELGPAIIAELKKASPSRGLIREEFNPEELAKELEEAGAAALSVLTDEDFFHGSLSNLRRASSVTRIPCLRKDFIVDESQILEARAHGADAILLIIAALTQEELQRFSTRAKEHSLDVLTEIHDETELHRALDVDSDLIGVNSRDLRTFKVDLQTALDLANMIPKDVLPVAESGIHRGSDIDKLCAAGYRAFLVGESLMKAKSPGEALLALLSESEAAR